MLLGCIGDDFTGSSDLGNTLVKQGMRTVQYVGVPKGDAAEDVEAGVVALKSRSIPAGEAVTQSLAALEWLQWQGCRQFLFKYCSTFDSTPEGNIGPVAEALADALDATQVLVCPAFPATGRSVYMGYLFVGDRLLSESGMETHPLTPMTDPDLRRWLALQVKGSVGHVPAQVVAKGPGMARARMLEEEAKGHRLLVADAIHDADLMTLGRAAKTLPLLTGGSGIAMGLPSNFAEDGLLSGNVSGWDGQAGPVAVLSGSCSNATRGQIEVHAQDNPTQEVTAEAAMVGEVTAESLADWVMAEQSAGIPLVYSSATPETVKAAQVRFGREVVAGKLEGLMAGLARALVVRGVTRLIVAGGETSGAVVEALAPESFRIGPEIDPGVPVVRPSEDLVLALKSGNFGAEDFFAKAASLMERGA